VPSAVEKGAPSARQRRGVTLVAVSIDPFFFKITE
jgi:hypothetical protein